MIIIILVSIIAGFIIALSKPIQKIRYIIGMMLDSEHDRYNDE